MSDDVRKKTSPGRSSGTGSALEKFLFLHNDEIHSFDYVIDSLVDICGHSAEQAEQCAVIAHYKGRCEVKKGHQKALVPVQVKLIQKGLKASIE